MLSEYEGPYAKKAGYPSIQVRRQHIMMKKLLGE